jgi:hypothetical protein
MIAHRFPDWQDALCAAAMWVHHPCVTRHSSSWNRIANVSSIDTIPRLGGCFCGDTARLTAALSEHIGRREESGYRAGRNEAVALSQAAIDDRPPCCDLRPPVSRLSARLVADLQVRRVDAGAVLVQTRGTSLRKPRRQQRALDGRRLPACQKHLLHIVGQG